MGAAARRSWDEKLRAHHGGVFVGLCRLSGVSRAGIAGRIALAGAPAGGQPAEKGILLRAYWIGIIGIAATLLWVIISYFLIKSSSRHHTDHREHVRKGLP